MWRDFLSTHILGQQDISLMISLFIDERIHTPASRNDDNLQSIIRV